MEKMRIAFKTKFDVSYPSENLQYFKRGEPREQLEKLLISSCRGYCMYCGKKVIVDRNQLIQLEHVVDRKGHTNQSVDKNNILEHCKYNLAISCGPCNQSYKKSIIKLDLKKYEPMEKCPETCDKKCDKYSIIRKDFEEKNAIILPPLGSDLAGEEAISYDLITHIYVPNEKITDEDAYFLVQNHIERFELNGARFSEVILDLCAKVLESIELGGNDINIICKHINDKTIENVIGLDFISFIEDNFKNSTCKELEEFCKLLIILDAISA